MEPKDRLHLLKEEQLDSLSSYIPEFSEENLAAIQQRVKQQTKGRGIRVRPKSISIIMAAVVCLFLVGFTQRERLLEAMEQVFNTNDSSLLEKAKESKAIATDQGIQIKSLGSYSTKEKTYAIVEITDLTQRRLGQDLQLLTENEVTDSTKVLEFDEKKQQAIVLIQLNTKPYRKEKITLKIKELGINQKIIREAIPNLNLAEVALANQKELEPIAVDEMESFINRANGYNLLPYQEATNKLKKGSLDLPLFQSKSAINNIAYKDGKLHILEQQLVRNEDPASFSLSDERVYSYLAKKNSPEKALEYLYTYDQGSEKMTSYHEVVYDIPKPEELGEYQLQQVKMSYQNQISGEWQLPLKFEKDLTEKVIKEDLTIPIEKQVEPLILREIRIDPVSLKLIIQSGLIIEGKGGLGQEQLPFKVVVHYLDGQELELKTQPQIKRADINLDGVTQVKVLEFQDYYFDVEKIRSITIGETEVEFGE